ncbi:MAG: hypothetical protein ACOVSW_13055 [Candidatus Kapaibacteriota bacterium]|jgi:hypothetical protein
MNGQISTRRQQLAHEIFSALQAQYPEISLLEIQPSPEHPDDTWIHVLAPMDEDREMAMNALAAHLESNILVEHDYHFSTLSQNPTLVES